GSPAQSSISSLRLRPSPLAVSYPSPMMLLNYPLVVTNVEMLCNQGGSRSKSSSLAVIISALRQTYQLEGLPGLYKGGHLYLLHQAIRDLLRFMSDRCIGLVESRCRPSTASGLQEGTQQERVVVAGDAAEEEEDSSSLRRLFLSRLATKYCIDCICYPVLLASTRAIVLRGDQESSWERVRLWCREEGLLTLFGGLAASLLSTALEEAFDFLLASCIDRCAEGSKVDMTDRLVLKACGGSVVSLFTAPVNYVGVIQRCQSPFPGFL
ncbi:unnamed protein product, partial [Polarella glacialis]